MQSGFAACRHGELHRTAEKDEVRAHGIGLDDVLAGSKARVEKKRKVVADGVTNLAQHQDRGRGAVELAAAVTGDLNGIDLAREAQALLPGIKVLLTTGYARETTSVDMESISHLELIRKPYRTAELCRRLRTLFDDR